jgi:hypothetical protein
VFLTNIGSLDSNREDFDNLYFYRNGDNVSVAIEETSTVRHMPLVTSQWLNINAYLRDRGYNDNELRTIAQIVGANSINDVHNFAPTEKGIGMFVVPPNFVELAEMNLWDYLFTLEPNDLYRQRPPTETEVEIDLPDPLPEILDQLGGNNTVTIIRCPDTGNITYNINNYYNPPPDNGGSGDGVDNAGFFKRLEAIRDALLAQPKIAIDLLGAMLQYLFVPSEDFFDDVIGGLQEEFYEKLPIIEQIQTLFANFIDQLSGASAEPPVFEFELWGSRMAVFDSAFFAQFRPIIHGIIIITSYYFFIKRLIRRHIPKALGGIEK